MTRTSTLLLTAAVLSTSVQAQLLDIYDSESGELITYTQQTVYGQPDSTILSADFPVVLNGTDGKEVGLKRYELSYPEGTENYFCWGDCWLSQPSGTHPLWYAIDPVVLSPGVQWNGFYADYQPFAISGVACFRFVWYDVDNLQDTVWMDVCFDVFEGAGIEDEASAVSRFDVAPNPVVGEDLTVITDIAMGSGRAELTLVNALGQRASVTSLQRGASRAVIPTEGLAPGLWYAQLSVDGRLTSSRPVVIAGH